MVPRPLCKSRALDRIGPTCLLRVNSVSLFTSSSSASEANPLDAGPVSGDKSLSLGRVHLWGEEMAQTCDKAC
jgi:hypothetical protein